MFIDIQPLKLASSISTAITQANDDGAFCHHIYSNSTSKAYRELLLNMMADKVTIFNALESAQEALTSIIYPKA